MDRMLGGRYRLISQLGIGGMGVTYRAWDRERGIPIVVKMPRTDQTDADALRRFAREIETMAALRHEHIVPITDQGEDGGIPFVVMRFLPGGSLADQRRVGAGGSIMPTPPGFLRFWLPAIADALDFVHRHGVIHRDVKPQNIFFDGFWHAFLGDFGIAKVLDESSGLAREQSLTAANVAMGTQEYMAPELFMKAGGEEAGVQVDQYALAVTVYEMIAGVKPFTGAQSHIAVEHLQMPPPSLQRAGLGLPASLCQAVDKALAKRPEGRFPTCSDFAAAAIKDIPALAAEPNIARLLCPKCTMVLRIPVTSGGRSGTCPKCKATMRIAADLGALWLDTEDVDDRTRPSAPHEPEHPFGFEEDLAEAALPTKPHPLHSVRRRWESLIDHASFDWPRAVAVVVPFVTAAATLAVTHEMWSIYHQGVVDDMERRRTADATKLEQRLAEGVREIGALRQENRSLRQEVADAAQVTAEASFDNATSLSPAVARNLARWKRGDLRLDHLTTLSEETAAALAKHEGVLSLDGLTRLSDGAARALTRHHGEVHLRGLLTVSPEAVQLLKANPQIKLPAQFR